MEDDGYTMSQIRREVCGFEWHTTGDFATHGIFWRRNRGHMNADAPAHGIFWRRKGCIGYSFIFSWNSQAKPGEHSKSTYSDPVRAILVVFFFSWFSSTSTNFEVSYVHQCVSLACCKDLRNTWHFILANGINRVIDKTTQMIQRPQRSLTERFSLCGPCRQSKAVFDEGDINRLRRCRSMFHYDIDLATKNTQKSICHVF